MKLIAHLKERYNILIKELYIVKYIHVIQLEMKQQFNFSLSVTSLI